MTIVEQAKRKLDLKDKEKRRSETEGLKDYREKKLQDYEEKKKEHELDMEILKLKQEIQNLQSQLSNNKRKGYDVV